MTAATPQPPPVSDLECKVCEHVSSPHGAAWAGSGFTEVAGDGTAGQAAYEAAVEWDTGFKQPILLTPWDKLADRERDCWNRVAQAAIAAQDARPAPEQSSALGLKHAVTSNRPGHALAALREIQDAHETGTAAHDTAHSALGDDAAIRDNAMLTREPRPAPELTNLRDRIAALADRITASAEATRPSRKSAIEDETAIALRQLMEGE